MSLGLCSIGLYNYNRDLTEDKIIMANVYDMPITETKHEVCLHFTAYLKGCLGTCLCRCERNYLLD